MTRPGRRAGAAGRHRRADGDRQDRPRDRARGAAARAVASRRRSCRPTRGRSTAASTSGRPRRRSRSGLGSSTTGSTSSIPTSRSRSRTSGHTRSRRCWRWATGAASGSSPAGRGSGCGRSTAGIDTEALPSDPAVRAELEATLATDGVEALAARLRPSRRRSPPAPTCATRVASSARSRSRRSAGTGRSRRHSATRAPVLGLQLVVEPPSTAGASPSARASPVRRRPRRGGTGTARALGPVAARLLRHRLPRELGVPRRHADAGRGDRRSTRSTTTQFAKRQTTWFRREPALAVVDATGDPRLAVLALVDQWLAGSPSPDDDAAARRRGA